MFLRRAAPALAKRAVARPAVTRSFAISTRLHKEAKPPVETLGEINEETKHLIKPLDEIKGYDDLLPPGGKPGTVPSDLEQATGLERLEILGKMQGIDVFDMRPLDASRTGTMKDPIIVKSFGDEQYVGCTGSPADSHTTLWLTISRERDIERCRECGSVYKMDYVGPPDDDHHDHHHDYPAYVHPYEGELKTIADYVKPEYR